MSVSIREVQGRRDLREFIKFPFRLYRGSDFWVPPLISSEKKSLNPELNPGFVGLRARYWLAEEGGQIRGRVAAFLPDDKKSQARFGYFDFEDDLAVSRELLSKVEHWAAEEGVAELQGPQGVTTFDQSALLVEGFEELPTSASSYNYPYYAKHLEAHGYEKEIDYVEYEISDLGEVNERSEKLARYVMKKKGIKLLDLKTRAEVRAHAREAFEVINEAYDGLHGYEPLSDGQILYYTEMYFSFLDPAFVKILIDREGQMAGVGISMPSLSRGLQAARGRLYPFGFLRLMKEVKKTDTLDLYLIAVRRKWRSAGLPSILMHETHKTLLERGLVRAETNGELESNEDVQAMWKGYGARLHKRRRIYRKALG